MSERYADENLSSNFVLGHNPVISKVDRYLSWQIRKQKLYPAMDMIEDLSEASFQFLNFV